MSKYKNVIENVETFLDINQFLEHTNIEDYRECSIQISKTDYLSIKKLLKLYNEEKEKNKKLNELQGYNILDIFNMGKESSRQRIKLDWIEKDKIKEEIKELEILADEDKGNGELYIRYITLKELLEE